MGLELYLDLLSQPCRAVFLFAKKNGIPFEFKQVDLVQGQQLGKEFTQVNPLQKVPALKDGDFTLAESTAILLYLARKFHTPDHWYPSDLRERARVDEYLSWQHMETRMAGSRLYLAQAIAPLLLGHPFPPEKLEEHAANLHKVLALFELKFLQDRPFIAGQHVSLADLVAIVELMQPVAAGHDFFKDRPKMAAWRSRVEEALGRDLFREAHRPLVASRDMTADQLPPEVKEKLKQVVQKYAG